MLGRRGGGVEGGHQESAARPVVPNRCGREVIGLVVGNGQRPLPGGGEAHGVDAVLDQHGLLAESPLGSASR